MTDSRQKCVFLIIDGLGDLPVASLGGRTPLEAARTPVMNMLAETGLYGVVDPVTRGEVPNTHSGSGMLFGVLPGQTERMKRGPVEASGAGRVLNAGEVAVRANFATLKDHEDGLLVVDRRAGRISSDTDKLAHDLRKLDLGDGVTASLQPTDQHRCVLILSGPGLDDTVSDTDPGDRISPPLFQACRPLHAKTADKAAEKAAEKTAEKINRFSAEAYRHLSSHPINSERERVGLLAANGILTRGAGAAFELESTLAERGINAAVVAGCNTVRGMARILGFEAISDPRFTASSDTDLQAKVATALQALENNDLAYVHVKAPDLFAHDKRPEAKRDFLELLDEALESLREAGVIVALTADHTTDSNSGAHTADPVPSFLYDPKASGRGEGKPVNFGEQACRNGNMARQSSHDFLLRLFRMMGY